MEAHITRAGPANAAILSGKPLERASRSIRRAVVGDQEMLDPLTEMVAQGGLDEVLLIADE